MEGTLYSPSSVSNRLLAVDEIWLREYKLISCRPAALPKAAGCVFVASVSPGITSLCCWVLGCRSCLAGFGVRGGSCAGWLSATCCGAAAQCFPWLALAGRPPGKGVLCPQWGLLPSYPCEFICWAPFLVS